MKQTAATQEEGKHTEAKKSACQECEVSKIQCLILSSDSVKPNLSEAKLKQLNRYPSHKPTALLNYPDDSSIFILININVITEKQQLFLLHNSVKHKNKNN